MKTMLVISALLLTSIAYADDAGTAFVTGFANALNVRMGGQPYQAPAQVNVNVTETQYVPVVRGAHWDARSFDNRLGGYFFFSQNECSRFLQRSGGVYTVCEQAY